MGTTLLSHGQEQNCTASADFASDSVVKLLGPSKSNHELQLQDCAMKTNRVFGV